MTVKQPG